MVDSRPVQRGHVDPGAHDVILLIVLAPSITTAFRVHVHHEVEVQLLVPLADLLVILVHDFYEIVHFGVSLGHVVVDEVKVDGREVFVLATVAHVDAQCDEPD